MTHVLTIARREISERRMVFIAAPIVAAMPFLFGVLPVVGAHNYVTRVASIGSIVSFAWTLAIAIALGTALISRELVDRRLSFYLTKPISATALWFGKLLGALLIIVTTFAIVLGPSLIVGWTGWRNTYEVPAGNVIAAVVTGAVALMLLMHALTSMIRSRSPLAALDLVLAAALVFGTWLIVRPLLDRMSLGSAGLVASIVVASVLLSIIPGGVWQIARGRSDVRASHAALSTFTWLSAFVVLAGAGAFVAWILSAGPNDLEDFHGGQAPNGDWAWVGGTAKNRRDFHPLFALNVRNGEHHSLPGAMVMEPMFSRDGNSVLWGRVAGWRSRGKAELMVTRLNPSVMTVATGYTTARFGVIGVLSDDGTRAAVIDGSRTLSVIELESQRILGSAKLPSPTGAKYSDLSLFFVDADTVRVYDHSVRELPTENRLRPDREQTMRAFEFVSSQRKLTMTGTLQRNAPFIRMTTAPDGSRILFSLPGAAEIVDGRTLQPILNIPTPAKWYGRLLLSNGDLAFVRTQDQRELAIMASDGTLRRSIPLAQDGNVWLFGEVAPGKVAALLSAAGARPGAGRIAIVDVARGIVQREDRGLLPFGPGTDTDPRLPPMGNPRRMLAFDEARTLWLWNPLTGEKSKLN